jgi:hypothetical protein
MATDGSQLELSIPEPELKVSENLRFDLSSHHVIMYHIL